jgi:hypothetical protein
MIRARAAHLLELVARVQDVVVAGLCVEAAGVPFCTRSVVRQKYDQRVFPFTIRAQVGEHAADLPVHAIDHRGEDRHASRQIPTPVPGQR